MTDNSARLPGLPDSTPEPVARSAEEEEVPGRPVVTGAEEGSLGRNEIAGLVLLINSVLGGLGTFYVTTKSVTVTLGSAVLILMIIVVVLAVGLRSGREARPGRKDDRSGQ
ncbi:hypothetical protein [Streptomyces sp. NPDC005485]|uniref:hypothetical protein n=1 Tax=Streptomyces sp. NPDC005485 TaxID=3155591 RepID=UPI0033AE406D